MSQDSSNPRTLATGLASWEKGSKIYYNLFQPSPLQFLLLFAIHSNLIFVSSVAILYFITTFVGAPRLMVSYHTIFRSTLQKIIKLLRHHFYHLLLQYGWWTSRYRVRVKKEFLLLIIKLRKGTHYKNSPLRYCKWKIKTHKYALKVVHRLIIFGSVRIPLLWWKGDKSSS